MKATATKTIHQYGCIPPQRFLYANGYGGWIHAAVSCYHDMDTIRNLYQGHPSPQYVARDGKAWKSCVEVAFANFLFARGVQYEKGRQY